VSFSNFLTTSNLEIHVSAQTVGVIFKTERDSFRVLDQNGQVRLVQPHQISMRRDSSKAVANDSEGHELRINDNVKEVDGAVGDVYSFFCCLN
jgi:transcription elongation factor SPT5